MVKDTQREEMKRLLAKRERHGWTYRELAQKSGVKAHTLSWWAWKLRQEEEAPGFVEVDVDVPARDAVAIEVEMPSGHILRIPSDFDDRSLRRLLGVLAEC